MNSSKIQGRKFKQKHRGKSPNFFLGGEKREKQRYQGNVANVLEEFPP